MDPLNVKSYSIGGVVFTIEREEPDLVVLRDRDGAKSVTNGAEYVVAWLAHLGKLTRSTVVAYYDTDGELDALLHDGARFIGFGHVFSPAILARLGR